MNELPPEFAQLASLMHVQDLVQIVFQYCLCLMMVEDGKMRLAETIVSGDRGAICVFETAAGGRFSVVKPPISQELEADVTEELREILEEDRL